MEKLLYWGIHDKNYRQKSVLSVAGVEEEYFVAEAATVDVDVDFGGGDAFVEQHLLD